MGMRLPEELELVIKARLGAPPSSRGQACCPLHSPRRLRRLRPSRSLPLPELEVRDQVRTPSQQWVECGTGREAFVVEVDRGGIFNLSRFGVCGMSAPSARPVVSLPTPSSARRVLRAVAACQTRRPPSWCCSPCGGCRNGRRACRRAWAPPGPSWERSASAPAARASARAAPRCASSR